MRLSYNEQVVELKKPNAEIYIPNELSYTIQFIIILSMSGEGRNAFTELKCQSFFSIR